MCWNAAKWYSMFFHRSLETENRYWPVPESSEIRLCRRSGGWHSIEDGTVRGVMQQHWSDNRPVLLANVGNEIELTILHC